MFSSRFLRFLFATATLMVCLIRTTTAAPILPSDDASVVARGLLDGLLPGGEADSPPVEQQQAFARPAPIKRHGGDVLDIDAVIDATIRGVGSLVAVADVDIGHDHHHGGGRGGRGGRRTSKREFGRKGNILDLDAVAVVNGVAAAIVDADVTGHGHNHHGHNHLDGISADVVAVVNPLLAAVADIDIGHTHH